MRVVLVVVVVLLVGAVAAAVGYGVGAAGGATSGTPEDHADLACQGAEGLPDELGAGDDGAGAVDPAEANAVAGVAWLAEAAAAGDDAYAALGEPGERLRTTLATLVLDDYPDAVADLRAACDDR